MIIIKDYILVQKIKNGDTNAWELLLNKYYDSIFSYCLRYCYGNRQTAEDLTQDIFLKLIENINRFQFTGKFYNYLFTITVNTCHNYFSKKKITELPIQDHELIAMDENSQLDTLLTQENNQFIQNGLNILNEDQREAIILKYYCDLKVKDIAKITKVSVSTAQSRIYQGIKKLEKILIRKEFVNE